RRYAYVGRGRYADQLRGWLAHYPRDRVHVMVAEELFATPEPVWQEAVSFLGLRAVTPPAFAVHNPGGGADARAPAVRARWARRLAAPTAALRELRGGPLPWCPAPAHAVGVPRPLPTRDLCACLDAGVPSGRRDTHTSPSRGRGRKMTFTPTG